MYSVKWKILFITYYIYNCVDSITLNHCKLWKIFQKERLRYFLRHMDIFKIIYCLKLQAYKIDLCLIENY